MKRIGYIFQCCIKDGLYLVETASANWRTDEVCKPPEGAVFKRHGAERSGKKCLKRHQVRVRKLKESEPTEDMSKRLLVVKSIDFQQLIRQTVTVICCRYATTLPLQVFLAAPLLHGVITCN